MRTSQAHSLRRVLKLIKSDSYFNISQSCSYVNVKQKDPWIRVSYTRKLQEQWFRFEYQWDVAQFKPVFTPGSSQHTAEQCKGTWNSLFTPFTYSILHSKFHPLDFHFSELHSEITLEKYTEELNSRLDGLLQEYFLPNSFLCSNWKPRIAEPRAVTRMCCS